MEFGGIKMVVFFSEFLSYLLLAVIFMCLIVAGTFVGKKLRDAKDKKDASVTENNGSEE